MMKIRDGRSGTLALWLSLLFAPGVMANSPVNYQFPPDTRTQAASGRYPVTAQPYAANTATYYGTPYPQQQMMQPYYYYPQYVMPYAGMQQPMLPQRPGYLQPYAANPAAMQQPASAPAYRYTSPYDPNRAATPGPKPPPPPAPKKEVKPWGDTRYIWPDFYTDFTGDFWDKMINAPYDMGYMPGGWRFPSFSSPDPVTVGDAVANQVPPILDESANFINFAN
ncbi:MAG: hypothetical protein R3E95_15025 [Thiolinea sp.]